jgi:hypothetical protein
VVRVKSQHGASSVEVWFADNTFNADIFVVVNGCATARIPYREWRVLYDFLERERTARAIKAKVPK